MQITKEFLIEKEACPEGFEWFLNQSETDLFKLIDKLIKKRKDWANWLIVRVMNRQQQLKYAIACAELTLPIFEKQIPQDNRPRLAIKATKRVLEDDSEENRDAALDAANAAYAAWAAARAAGVATDAAWAAWAAARAAEAACAAHAAHAAHAAEAAARAACAADATSAASWEQVIRIGINILKGNN